MQKRTGKKEQVSINRAVKQISNYKILRRDVKRQETFFNHLLFRHLVQVEPRATNKGIHKVSLVGETFRPEFCIAGRSQHPLFCVECKKLTDATAKGRFKEGLSQALVYSNEYKCVLLVFYDFTKNATYARSFSNKGTSETKLIAGLWKHHRIKVIFIIPQ